MNTQNSSPSAAEKQEGHIRAFLGKTPTLVSGRAEQALLGAILRDSRAYDAVALFLEPKHFYHELHSDLFAGCVKRLEAGQPLDAVLLHADLIENEALDAAGGQGYLAGLLQEVPSVINAGDYGAVIHDLYKRRLHNEICKDQILAGWDLDQDAEASDILEKTQERLQEIIDGTLRTGPVPIGTGMADFLPQLEDKRERGGGLSGISTGFLDLDRITNGLSPGQIIVIAARPSMGKTALATNLATRVARAGHPVLIFSLEMGADMIHKRILAESAGISFARLESAQDLSDAEMAQIARVAAKTETLPLHLDDSPRLSVQAMQTRARQVKRKGGLDLIVIDHLGYVALPDPTGHRAHEIGRVMKRIREMAKALGVPVVLLCQLNRLSQQRDDKRPQLADLRDSGEVEEDADVVLLLHRQYYYHCRNIPQKKSKDDLEFKRKMAEWEETSQEIKHKAELNAAKNRNGPSELLTIHFREDTMAFDNYQQKEPRHA